MGNVLSLYKQYKSSMTSPDYIAHTLFEFKVISLEVMTRIFRLTDNNAPFVNTI